MMNTKRVIHVCVIAALALMGASATAGQPSGQGAAAPSKQAVKPAQQRCAAAPPANGYGDDGRPSRPAGIHAQDYAHGLMRNTGKADLDGSTNPCRLEDTDPQEEANTDDGVDLSKLLDKIDDWSAMNRRPFDDDGHDVDWRGQQLSFEFEGTDHRMHAYVGYSRIVGNRLFHQQQQWQPLTWRDGWAADGIMGPLHGAASNGDQQSLINSNTQPVPEPSAWAMLLAGLALVGMALRPRVG